jgi:hypothetical protein
MIEPVTEARTITTLTRALDTLFNDRRRIRGIRIDGHNGHTFSFKVYHERRDADSPRNNTTFSALTDFDAGLEYAVREGFYRSSDVELALELAANIHMGGIRKYVERGNSAVLRPSSPTIALPSVQLYSGHNIRQHPLLVIGAPTVTTAIGMAHVGTINEAIKQSVPYESQMLLSATGEFPTAGRERLIEHTEG